MHWTLPPLNAVRAFEAVGRRHSFSAAAAELGVTTGAISRHIKNLEYFLGTPVFDRSNGVALTEDGRAYFEQISDMLRRMDAATASIRDRRQQRSLRVTCCASFTARWLFPRLPRFHKRYPAARLAISTLPNPRSHLDDLEGDDVVIRCGDGSGAGGVEQHFLFASELIPICSPAVIPGPIARGSIGELTHQTLLASSFRPNAWARWFEALGETRVDFAHVTNFESGGLTYQAATMGLGVALGERRFVQTDIAQGLLHSPAPFAHASGEAFYLTSRQGAQKAPYYAEFRSWLSREIERDRPQDTPARRLVAQGDRRAPMPALGSVA